MLVALFLAVALPLVACTGGAPSTTARPDDGGARVVEKRTITEEKTVKVIPAACLAAIGEAMPRTSGGMASLASACQSIYSEPGCRAAFQNLAETSPPDPLIALTDGCARAYCPRFQPHDPLCDQDLTKLDHTQITQAWAHLNARIFSLETGLSEDAAPVKDFVRIFATTETVSVDLPHAATVDAGVEIIVRVAVAPAGAVTFTPSPERRRSQEPRRPPPTLPPSPTPPPARPARTAAS